MKVLLDTNIVLDLILEREPFVETATTIFEHIERGNIQGYITATTITNVFYIVRKNRDREIALTTIHQLLAGLELCPVDCQVIQIALELNLNDFEDSVQLACAIIHQLPAIVTRNLKDFVNSPLSVYSPQQLIERIESDK